MSAANQKEICQCQAATIFRITNPLTHFTLQFPHGFLTCLMVGRKFEVVCYCRSLLLPCSMSFSISIVSLTCCASTGQRGRQAAGRLPWEGGVAAANDLRSAPRQFHNGHVCKQWPKSGRCYARASKWECAKLSAAILSAGGFTKTHKQKKARKNVARFLRLWYTHYFNHIKTSKIPLSKLPYIS